MFHQGPAHVKKNRKGVIFGYCPECKVRFGEYPGTQAHHYVIDNAQFFEEEKPEPGAGPLPVPETQKGETVDIEQAIAESKNRKEQPKGGGGLPLYW